MCSAGKYIINGELMKLVKNDAVVMHPLPRVDEVRLNDAAGKRWIVRLVVATTAVERTAAAACTVAADADCVACLQPHGLPMLPS